MAERLHVLPYSGGLLEQPPRALFRMEAILAAQRTVDGASGNKQDAQNRLKERTDS